jgi:hypothetical protein
MLVALLSGCAASGMRAEIGLLKEEILHERRPESVSFTVPIVIRNTGAVPVNLGHCGRMAEKLIAGEWRAVWSPICQSAGFAEPPILPGDSLLDSVKVAGFTLANHLPVINVDSIPGTYRLQVAFYERAPSERDPAPGVYWIVTRPFQVY